MAALHKWLGMSTWYKWHPIDNGRFYEFIHAVWEELHGLWDEQWAREIMEREARELYPEYTDVLITESVQRRREEGSLILDYLSHLREEGII